MDVVGGDHGALAFGAGSVFDPTKDSPLALAEFVEDISFHSKVSVVWPSEDMRPPPLLPNHRGFSSFGDRHVEIYPEFGFPVLRYDARL
jgi:hypothetical protein